MAKTKTGTATIVKLTRKICRLVGIYGAADLGAKTTPAFATAVSALVSACLAFEALDDFPYQIDSSAPLGPEDQAP